MTGQVGNDPEALLGSGAAVSLTNVIVFGIWYWELDRGGPIVRSSIDRPYPGFILPEMANPELAPRIWRRGSMTTST